VLVEVKGTKMCDADKMDNFIVKKSVTDSMGTEGCDESSVLSIM